MTIASTALDHLLPHKEALQCHVKERLQAHILVCFLAYVLWKTLGQMCKAAAKIRVVEVVLPIRSGQSIRRRCVTAPNDHQVILLQRLGLNLPKNLPLTRPF